MADRTPGARAPGDANLLDQVRAGDTSAFGVLYQRHVQAVRRLARELVMSPAEADHLVAETFSLVHDLTQRGGGPTDAFRPYLLTVLRRVSADQVRNLRMAAHGDHGPGDPLTAADVANLENSRVARAFLSLPERWRTVLWHAEIEQDAAAEMAPILGIAPSEVAALRTRATERMRQAVVRTHIARADRPECQQVAELLGERQHGTLAASDASAVTMHLGECADCTAVSAALAGITAALCDQVAPVFLGSAAMPYLLGARRAAAAGSAARTAADTSELGAAGLAAGTAGALSRLRNASGRAWLGGGAVLSACAIAGVAFAASGTSHHDAAGAKAGSGPSAGVTASAGLNQNSLSSPVPSPAGSRKAASGRPTPTSRTPAQSTSPATPATRAPRTGSPVPTTSPTTGPSPKASPAPAVTLTSAVSIDGGQGFLQVSIQVNDTGNAATGQLSATITLPSGAIFIAVEHHDSAGWSCQPDSSGASCQHAAIAAGGQAAGTIVIAAGGPSCGQPVQLSATSGSASTSAQSGNISCGNDESVRLAGWLAG